MLVSCPRNNRTLDWSIADAERPRRSARIPEGLCVFRRGRLCAERGQPYGASVFWRTAAAKCGGDGRHRLSQFAAPVHPEYARPMCGYFWETTLARMVHTFPAARAESTALAALVDETRTARTASQVHRLPRQRRGMLILLHLQAPQEQHSPLASTRGRQAAMKKCEQCGLGSGGTDFQAQ